MKLAKTKPKILVLDIESLPNILYAFDLFSYNRPHNIIQECAIITFSWKWHGEKGRAQSMSSLDFAKGKKYDPYDDSKLVAAIGDLLAEADYVVAHFTKFDMRYIRARSIINNLKPPARPTEICTYRLAKKFFKLNANRLDYLGKLFGFGGKMPMNWTFWERCANGDEAAIKKMAAYNRQDVDLLDKVFTHMKPHVELPINFKLFVPTKGASCPSCGSTKAQHRGYRLTKVTRHRRMQCNDCGTWYSVKPSEEKDEKAKELRNQSK